MQVPKPYAKRALAIYETFVVQPQVKGQRALLSIAQLRQQVRAMVEQCQREDGDPSTWTDCEHCDGEGMYFGPATPAEQQASDFLDRVQPDGTVSRGICYQCWGKGKQSEADRRRNAGYQWHRSNEVRP